MSCNISASIGLLCADQRQAAGVNRRLWLGNLDELSDDAYTLDGSNYVTAISFETYAGLYTFEGPKNSHVFTINGSIEEGANKFFLHGGTMKLFSSDPTDDATIESLLPSNLFAVVEDNNQEFFIYGGYAGMEVTELTRSTQAKTGDTAFSITLEGQEKGMPLRVLDTDYATTKALLESYQV